jgi:Ribosomal protein L4/L1 family
VAAEGDRSRPRGHDPCLAVDRRRIGVPASDELRREGEPQSPSRRVPRWLSAHAARSSFGVVDAGVFDEPSTKQAVAFLEEWGQERPLLIVATSDEDNVAKSFRNIERVEIVEPAELEVAALAWARSLLVTQAALPLVEARASGTVKETA